MLNLSLKSLTDSAVEDLFASLPFHSILMLEDIDATKPLKREGIKGDNAEPVRIKDEISEAGGDAGAMRMYMRRDREGASQANPVTLSGLLNAIDGIGASEGAIHSRPPSHYTVADC